MKGLITLAFIVIINSSFSQTKRFEGNWVSGANEMISFNSNYQKKSTLTSKTKSNDFYLVLNSDTISFQSRYYSSEDNFQKLIVDKYDFKIQKSNDSILIIKPISKFSIDFYESDNPITFKNQDFIRDESFEFEKLVFHTSTCYGSCPVIHLEILKEGELKLNGTYFESRSMSLVKDSARSGSFVGKLSSSDLKELKDLIVKSRITTFEDSKDSMLCCDGAVKTIILYHSGKRIYIEEMFEPRLLGELISFLYQIDQKAIMKRTDEKFEFEK